MAHPESTHSLQPYWVYAVVLLSLLTLTALTVWAAGIHLGGWNIRVALLIASVKASIVSLFFMHLRFEGRWIWGFAAFSVFLLFPLIILTVMDALHGLAR